MENPKEKNEETWDSSGASVEIELITQDVYLMGANDYEIPTLRRLKADVLAGNIDPTEAVKQARKIISSKADYH